MIARTTTPPTTTLTIRLLASTSSKGRCCISSTSRVFRTFSSIAASNNNNGRCHFSASPGIDDVDEEDDNDDNSSLSLSTVVATNDHHQQQQQHQQVEGGVTALILGKPGGGKGTISNKILEDFPNFKHLSTGDMLRQHVHDCTSLGKEAKTYMNNGQLVPDNIMIQMVLNEAIANDDNNNKGHQQHSSSLLLDGFPRTMEQAIALDNVMDINFVINLNIPTETIVKRISDRWIHAPSGRVYSYSYKPPKVVGKDDFTGEPLVQRCDDEASKVRQRLEAYDKITFPLIDYYNQKGILQTFSGTMSDVIYPNVKEYLTNKLQEQEVKK